MTLNHFQMPRLHWIFISPCEIIRAVTAVHIGQWGETVAQGGPSVFYEGVRNSNTKHFLNTSYLPAWHGEKCPVYISHWKPLKTPWDQCLHYPCFAYAGTGTYILESRANQHATKETKLKCVSDLETEKFCLLCPLSGKTKQNKKTQPKPLIHSISISYSVTGDSIQAEIGPGLMGGSLVG